MVAIVGALAGSLVFRLIGLNELGLISMVIGAALGAGISPFLLRLLKRKYGL